MPDDEKGFQKWYAEWAKKINKKERRIDPNPNHWKHYYDYRAAFKAGDKPRFDEGDKEWHWPSKHKHNLHPNRFIKAEGKWLDTKNDKVVDMRVVNEQKVERKIYEKGKKQ